MTDVTELKNTKGKILGVDFGDVRTGLAVSDPTRFLASGLYYVSPAASKRPPTKVAEIAKEQRVGAVVVGLPVNMDGSLGFRSERVKEFADLLRARLDGIPVVLYDERMSTMEASRYLGETGTHGKKRKGVIDTLSAQIILQNALDKLKNIR